MYLLEFEKKKKTKKKQHFINHENFFKVSEEMGVGTDQRKSLDKYLTSGIVRTRSIQGSRDIQF